LFTKRIPARYPLRTEGACDCLLKHSRTRSDNMAAARCRNRFAASTRNRHGPAKGHLLDL